MNWFFVVLLASSDFIGYNDGFLWHNPTFLSEAECQMWVANNTPIIIQHLNQEFDNWTVQSALCVREDRLQDLNIIPYVDGLQI